VLAANLAGGDATFVLFADVDNLLLSEPIFSCENPFLLQVKFSLLLVYLAGAM
jgi:hypothetical protein